MKKYLRPRSDWFPFQHLLLLGTFIYALTQNFAIEYWLISLAMWYVMITFGINFTFHRLLSHKSFVTYKPVEMLGTFFGTIANTGSSLAWVMMHRQHHHYTDVKYDPHSPHEYGWKVLFSLYNDDLFIDKPSAALMYARHMLKDKFHVIMHDYYHVVILLYWFTLFIFGGMELVLFAGTIPAFMSVASTNLSNYFNHKSGYRTYDIADQSRNTPFMLPIALGENWHNNHHHSPANAFPGERWWEIDPVKPLILLFRK
jgi:stearoyl-CoA desaturase (delta-9 desaturase)